MYVAATRAAFWLGCSGYWWGEGASQLGPSPFLDEVRRACQAGTGRIDEWAPPPAEDAVNPALAEPAAASWPETPAGQRYEAVREGADLVLAAAQDARDAQDPGTAETPGRKDPVGRATPRRDPGDPRHRGPRRAERGGSGPGRGLAAGRRTAAGRAGAPPHRRWPAGRPARSSVRVVAGHAGSRPGRAGPPGAPADAPPTGPVRPPRHRVPPVAGGTLRAATADRHRRPVRCGRPAGRAGTGGPGRSRSRGGPGRAAKAVRKPASGRAGGRARSRCRSRR